MKKTKEQSIPTAANPVTAESGTSEISSAKPKERVYTKDELIDQAEALFQVKKEVVLGALYGNTQEHFSLNELRGTIKQFLLRKVEA